MVQIRGVLMTSDEQTKIVEALTPILQEYFEDFVLVGHSEGERFMMNHTESQKDCDAITELLRVVLDHVDIPKTVQVINGND